MTLSAWLRMAAARLTHEGIASAPLEAQLLAAHGLRVDRAFVLTHPDAPVPDDELEPLLERRANQEPLAYILGRREFFGRSFLVTPDVLIPRQETELLIEIALLRYPNDVALDALDIGTGSGAIAVTLKQERPAWRMHATDISDAALEVARENAAAQNVKVAFETADLFPSSPQRFHLIVSNPPYVAAGELVGPDVLFEPKVALYAENMGLAVYHRLADEALAHLLPEGELWVEIGSTQGDQIVERFERSGWSTIGRLRDLAGHERALGFRQCHRQEEPPAA